MLELAVFQYDLGIGGVQRSLINLLKNIDLKKYNVDLYLFDSDSFYDDSVPKGVNIIRSKKLPVYMKLVPFRVACRIYRSNFPKDKTYDISIDFNGYQNITAIGALNVLSQKKVLWIHNDVTERLRTDFKYKVMWQLQRKKLEYFDEYVAVSNGIVSSFQSAYNVGSKPIRVINNYINSSEIIAKSNEQIDFSPDKQNYNLVSVGRLSKEKNIGEMLKIIKSVIPKRRSIHLYLIGDGPEKQNLETAVKGLGIEDFVDFLGAKSNPYPYMKKMDGLISTSLHEGQGISILEAKCLGLDIFIPPRLEKYTYMINGHEDIKEQLVRAVRHKHANDYLDDYNENIRVCLESMLSIGATNEKK